MQGAISAPVVLLLVAVEGVCCAVLCCAVIKMSSGVVANLGQTQARSCRHPPPSAPHKHPLSLFDVLASILPAWMLQPSPCSPVSAGWQRNASRAAAAGAGSQRDGHGWQGRQEFSLLAAAGRAAHVHVRV